MIRSFGLALAAIVALAATPVLAQGYGGSPSSGAMNNNNNAQQPDRGAPSTPPKIDTKIEPKNHDQGMKEAAAAVATAGVTCDVSDAYFINEGDVPDTAGKKIKSKIYEVACKDNLAQILINPSVPGTPSHHYDCISISASPNLRCRLPGDTDPKALIAPVVAATGRTCTVSDVRSVGSTPAGDNFFEVACSNDLGFLVKRGADGKSVAEDCARTLGTNIECKFTTKTMIDAKMAAIVQALVTKSGKPCQISGQREVGIDPASGGIYYEVACGASGGFMALSDKQGNPVRTFDCANASGLAGGCTLTDATLAQTQEAATYSKLAAASGFQCQVSKYHYVGIDQTNKSEVVELACSNRPDGGIAVLPADNSPGHVYDCVRAGALGQTCHLSDPALVYSRYTDALVAKGKSSCKVSNAHWIGHSASDNTDLIETACADGLSGWVTVMNPSNQIVDVLSCGQAKGAGVQCTLPGNTK